MSEPPPDYFSAVAGPYARFRPTYPAALFAWLASVAPGRSLAWDCAAGSGQASVDLAAHFDRVVATDLSRAQVEAATAHPRVEYRVARAQASGLPEGSVDLATVAQALHWLDLAPFYAEARRVLRPAGVVAAWTYGTLAVEGAVVDAAVQAFYRATLGPYWPPERVHVESGYRTLPFPFEEVPAPAFAMTARWPLAGLLGYLASWSATGRFIQANGVDPVPALAEGLRPLWGGEERLRTITWPFSLRVGRVGAP
jgi:SAM-dependent methyltransferase